MNYWHMTIHKDTENRSKEKIREILDKTALIGPYYNENNLQPTEDFQNEMAIGDVVFIRCDGPVALVQVTGEPEFTDNPNQELDWFTLRRPIEVLAYYDDWKSELPSKNDRPYTGEYEYDNVNKYKNYTNTLIKCNRFEGSINKESFYIGDFIKHWYKLVKPEHLSDIHKVLTNRSQLILQGPPGTGKTRKAKELAYELITGKELPQDEIERKEALRNTSISEQMRLVQFHPSYDYIDFVRGIATEVRNGQVHYEVKDRVLAEMAQKADGDRANNYVLIIDEINRANLPAVFGELIYALEYRGEVVHSMYAKDGDTRIVLPGNLFIIGTMNTADRSIGQMDYALRRRFSFYDMLPEADVLPEQSPSRKLFDEVVEIFTNHTSPDFQKNDVQIGHSYFMVNQDDDGTKLQRRLEFEIKPILYEYIKDGVLNDKAEEQVNQLRIS